MAKKVYFASDFHLGIDALQTSKEREIKIVKWLDSITDDMDSLYLVGDVFDYWYEYKRVVPKSYVRLFGKLASLRDAGIPIYFFIGNHDMWMFNYFEEEFGIPTYRAPIEREIMGKKFFIGHGDGLGPGDHGYKFIKSIFNNKYCQWAFSLLHPNLALGIMKYFSQKSRQYTGDEDPFTDPHREWLVQFVENHPKKNHLDYFVFGHRHLPIDYKLSNSNTRYINLGEWMFASSYAVFDGNEIEIKFFESEIDHVFGNQSLNQ